MKFVISGGGTGGHIYPAIAIANKIRERLPSSEILFIGTEGGLEWDIVPRAGYPIKPITVTYIKRKISLHNIKSGFMLLKGIWEARGILKEFKPDVVIGTGGFVCGPVLYSASILGMKTIIHEQNVYPGLTNRILAKYVDIILLSFQEASKYFKEKNKLVYTGNPIRKDFFTLSTEEAKLKHCKTPQPLVLVVGGSGGSYRLNNAMLELIKDSNPLPFSFIWATGKGHYETIQSQINMNSIQHNVMPYIDDMAYAVKAADLVVCSAGAITIAELTAAGKASILIPKAYTAENHQEYNAKAMEDKGAAIMLKEQQLTSEALLTNINNILFHQKRLEAMEKASLDSAVLDADERIFKEIIKL